MGIKENFTQAVRELTGAASPKDSKDSKSSQQVEDLRRAVEADSVDRPVAPEIPPAPVPVAGGFSNTLPPSQPDFSAPYYPNTAGVPNGQAPVASANVPYEQDMAVSPAQQTNQNGFEAMFPGAPKTSPALNMQDMSQSPSVPPPVFPNATAFPNPADANNTAGVKNPASDPFASTRIVPESPVPMMETPQMRAAEPSPVNPYPRAVEPSPVAGFFNMGNQPAMNPLTNPTAPVAPEGMEEEITVISRNTVVEGNVRSFANMNIDGNIRGDIETTKNVELNGKIIGNLTCNNAQMLTSQIQGNIRMKGQVLMGRDTLLIGDLVSTYAKVNGKVKGNMEVGGKAELKGDAVIFGDISASTITVDDGAIIQGYVSTTFLNKEESRNIFPEAISIAE
jgi:cytoskeletal protein CcmA (bactofilin family)